MVRRCCVPNCPENDTTILSHRFPKDNEIAASWQAALQIENYSLEDLQKKYSVCTKHFSASSYRNEISNSLNTTAMPSLTEHPDNQRITLTRNRDKNSTPMRCQKRSSTTSNNDQTPPMTLKKIKIEMKGIKKEVAETKQNESAEEEEKEEQDIFYNDSMANDLVDIFENQAESTTIVLVNNSTMTNNIIRKNVATQTTAVNKTEIESKDESLIKLLYPEFKQFSKLDLIKLILEKNDAIRELMK